MRRPAAWSALFLSVTLSACASIIGADFNGYSPKGTGGTGGAAGGTGTGGISTATGGISGTACTPPNPTECPSDTRCEFTNDTSTPICAGPAGTFGPYVSCSSGSDCRNDLGCRQIGSELDDTPISLCLDWATWEAQCSPNEQFVLPGNAPMYGGDSYGFCYGSCNPENPAATGSFRPCAGSSRCSFLKDDTGTQSVTACFTAGREQINAICNDENDCAAGLACRDVCVPYCDLSDPGSCADPDETCTPFTNIRKVGTTEFGFCRDPNNCDPVSGVPCTATTRCYLALDDFAVCVPDTGTRKLGEECSGFAQCTGTNSCIGSATSGYYCKQYCRIGYSDCPSGTCNSLATPEHIGGVEYGVCDAPDCNPFDPNAGSPFVRCTSGLECRFSTSQTAHCQEGPGTVAQGDPCDAAKDCQSGMVCVFWDGVGSCYPACRTSLGTTDNADCPSSLATCYTFSSANVMSGIEVGYCGN